MHAAPASRIDPPFPALEPAAVWAHFATLCRIPRQSKAEGRLRDEILGWARARHLSASVDPVGNLLVAKPASGGSEGAPGMVLQAHLDMVCQKNAGTAHDFSRDAIRPLCRDGWLVADETTLGADNGIGVALILAVLEDCSLRHGPIEALLTVDEEAGMGGAHGLRADLLQGRLLLNLDTEEWGEFYLGCAGGLDVNVSRSGRAQAVPAAFVGQRIDLRGLRGGHSGIDIHSGRGNAIKLLVRVLIDLERRCGLRLAGLTGGSARNALPREASATLAMPRAELGSLSAGVAAWEALLREELRDVDDGLRIELTPTAVDRLLAVDDQAVWLTSLAAAPHGVRHWSPHFAGVVETSNNLGMVGISPLAGGCNFLVRSLVDSGSSALADEIVDLFAKAGMLAEKADQYPGWAPNPGSPLLALCQSVYRQQFGGESRVQVIHAGLECGLIAARYPELDMVSFGPTIRGAHAPGERVEIESVARCWQLLTAILAAVAGLAVGDGPVT